MTSHSVRRITVVDVFSSVPTLGNPVAVVLDAEGLDDAAMQRIARWTNLSETTFVLPPRDPAATHRLRIFTPRSELPFAGHPTLGSAHALLGSGRVDPDSARLVQECGAGLVTILPSREAGIARYRLRLPEARLADLPPGHLAELQAALGGALDDGVAPALVDVGPVWLVARMPSVEALLALRPDFGRLAALERRLPATGITLFAGHDPGPEADLEVRSFAPSSGVDEDPVCGSGNGSVAAFRRARGLLPAAGLEYRATQGRAVGRDGQVAVRVEGDGVIWVGGACVSTLQGRLTLD